MVAGAFCFCEKRLMSELKMMKKTNPQTKNQPQLIYFTDILMECRAVLSKNICFEG